MDFEACELRRNGVRVSLQDQPVRLLSALLERPGQVVTREELRAKIWPADTFVDFDASLNIAVLKVRHALDDSAAHPQFIQTVPRRGYRFLATVEVVAPISATSLSQVHRATQHNLTGLRRALILICAIIAVPGIGWYLYLGSRPAINQTWTVRPLTTRPGVECSPSFSPDGNYIAFSRMAPGDSNIFVMPAKGGDAVQITRGPADEIAPRWSPDGRRIAFLSDEGGTKKIYMIPPGGGVAEFVANTNVPYLERFTEAWKTIGSTPWSPDAKYLLFLQLRDDGQISVWKTDLETHEETRITTPPPNSDDLVPAWSPNGK